MERWIGKVAVVTGASAGIGAAIVEELVRNGMKVVGFARRAERVQELANKLSGEKGKLYAVKADISNEGEVKAGFKWVRENLGAVYVLVNNAGIANGVRLTDLDKPDVMRKLFETNVIGLSLCTREAIRMMKETGVDDGHIIHISSIAGQSIINSPGHFPYGATKHALRVLTEGLRRELVEEKSSIRVTELAEKLSGEKGKLYAVKVDVSNEEDVKAGFKWVRENLGTVHVLINNAGIVERFCLTDMEKPDRMRKLFETNVIGLSLCTGEAIRMMKETGVNDGHIIHINSVAGQSIVNAPTFYPYGATKHAVRVLTEGLRRELVEEKTSIRVTSVSPGLVKTEIFEASGSGDSGDTFFNENPYLNSKDIADCVIFALGCPSHVQIHELTVRPVGDRY